jgi:hypothetical protein
MEVWSWDSFGAWFDWGLDWRGKEACLGVDEIKVLWVKRRGDAARIEGENEIDNVMNSQLGPVCYGGSTSRERKGIVEGYILLSK